MTSLVGIDQGTSGTTVIVADEHAQIHSKAARALPSIHGDHGAVEQDPWAVLETVVDATSEAIDGHISEGSNVSAGFAHQGETVLAWDKGSLQPLTPAIVWSDRRAQTVVDALTSERGDARVAKVSGMRLDAYFCAAKYRWLLDNHPELTTAAANENLVLGTLETWLIAQLGLDPLTDSGTASRTQLVALGEKTWNRELLSVFGIDPTWLVPIVPSLYFRGNLQHHTWPVDLPLHAVAVDQPAALVGAGALVPGDMKVTYGTGAFVVAYSGRSKPRHQLDVVSSVGWSDSRGPHFIMDGGVLSAGSALDWLAQVGIDTSPDAHRRLTGRGPSSVHVLPSIHGLGAPSWDRSAAGAISGIRADTTSSDIFHGFLDAIAFRVKEIIDAMVKAGVPRPKRLRVDGGISQSEYLMQMQADILDLPVSVASTEEATGLGVAVLAGESMGAPRIRTLAERLGTSTRTYLPLDAGAARRAFMTWRQEFAR